MARHSIWVLFVGLLVLIGCSKKATGIVGTWTSRTKLSGVDSTTEETFNENGTFRSVTNASKGAAGLVATDTGTWTYKDGKLTEMVTDVNWDFQGNTPGIERARARFAANKPKIMAEVNKHPTETITWKGDDQFTYTDEENIPFTYNRKK